jgi:uncharacterized Zn finger protein
MKINPCPNCSSESVATDSSDIVEIKKCGYQSMWLICEDCGTATDPFEIDDCMTEEKRNRILLEMVKSWNEMELF